MTPVATAAYMQPMRARRPRAVLVREPSETQDMRYGFDEGCRVALSVSRLLLSPRSEISVDGAALGVSREFHVSRKGAFGGEIGKRVLVGIPIGGWWYRLGVWNATCDCAQGRLKKITSASATAHEYLIYLKRTYVTL